MMENNVQPSFIPKKALSQTLAKPQRPTNLFSLAAKWLFALSFILAGAAFGFNWYFNNQLAARRDTLQQKLSSFDSALVNQLSRFDSKIESAKTLLQNHLSLPLFFSALGDATLKSVSLSNFTFTKNSDQDISVSMKGTAKSYTSVALQQLEFSKPEHQKYFRNPTFSDLALDANGNVVFSLSTSVNPQYLILGGTQASVAPAPLATSTSTSTPN